MHKFAEAAQSPVRALFASTPLASGEPSVGYLTMIYGGHIGVLAFARLTRGEHPHIYLQPQMQTDCGCPVGNQSQGQGQDDPFKIWVGPLQSRLRSNWSRFTSKPVLLTGQWQQTKLC